MPKRERDDWIILSQSELTDCCFVHNKSDWVSFKATTSELIIACAATKLVMMSRIILDPQFYCQVPSLNSLPIMQVRLPSSEKVKEIQDSRRVLVILVLIVHNLYRCLLSIFNYYYHHHALPGFNINRSIGIKSTLYAISDVQRYIKLIYNRLTILKNI